MYRILKQCVFLAFFAAISLNAWSQERVPQIPCDWANIDATNPHCDRPQAILKQYRNASSYADHQSLLTDINQLRNDEHQLRVKSGKDHLYDPYIDEATMNWLDWYQVALIAREENRQLLDSEHWRAVIQLAHRDPYAAIDRLNKMRTATDENEKALSLLLTGMLHMRLHILVEAANYAAFLIKSKDRDQQIRSQRLEAYIQKHQHLFYKGETCYGDNYKGQHFFAVENQFPQSRYAPAAGYLAMSLNPCGECEGDFSCYLSAALAPTKKFLSKYPQSDYVTILLSRVQNSIKGHFIDQEARSDYLTKNDPKQSRDIQPGDYVPLEAANILIGFEKTLVHLNPKQLVSSKFLLGDMYVNLGQMENAKRVHKWLSENAPESPEWAQLGSSILSPRFSRPMKDPNLIATRKKQLRKNYFLQECELEKAWLGQEGIHCQDARLMQ